MLGKYAWTKVSSICRYSMKKRHPQNADALVLTGNGKEKLWDHQQHLKVSVNTASTEHISKEECYHENHTSLWCHPATPSPQTVFFSEFCALFITMTLSLGLHSPNSFAHTITEVFFKGTLSLFPTQNLLKQTVEQNRKFQKNQWSELRKLGQWVKVPAMWAQWPKFNLWNPCKGGKLEPTKFFSDLYIHKAMASALEHTHPSHRHASKVQRIGSDWAVLRKGCRQPVCRWDLDKVKKIVKNKITLVKEYGVPEGENASSWRHCRCQL